MRILRMLCTPFSQQSAGTEPLALPDLTRLKPLPCPVSWPYQPLHVGPPPLPCTQALPPSTGQASLFYPWQSLGPTTPHRLGLHFPCPLPLPWPYQPSQVPLHCLMIYAITLVFSFPAPFSYFPLFPSPPKGPSSHP